MEDGAAKVVLQVPNEAEMLALDLAAGDAGLVHYLVQDAGRTQIPAGSLTVLAIGPARKDRIDQITGHLRLL
jgi:PTH2 family peptidyl-tRNA hydrolase